MSVSKSVTLYVLPLPVLNQEWADASMAVHGQP